jgi:hypothetical protein
VWVIPARQTILTKISLRADLLNMLCQRYCTFNVSVSVRVTLPLLAITVMGNVSTEVLPPVLTVKVVDPDPLMDCAPRLDVAPI